MVLMLAQCSWTPEKGKDRENHFSNTAYQPLHLFLPEVAFYRQKEKQRKMRKFLSSSAEPRTNQYLHSLTLLLIYLLT